MAAGVRPECHPTGYNLNVSAHVQKRLSGNRAFSRNADARLASVKLAI